MVTYEQAVEAAARAFLRAVADANDRDTADVRAA